MLQQQTTEVESPQFTPPSVYEPMQTPETTSGEAVKGTVAETLAEQTGADAHATASATALNALIQQEFRLKRRDDYVMLAWTAAFTFIMVATTRSVVNEAGSGAGMDPTTAMKYTLLLLVASGAVTMGLILRRSYRRKTALTQELNKNHDTALIGPLVDTLSVESTPVRNLSKRALIPLLPTLKASDADLLTEARRDRLLRLLAISPNDTGYRDLTEIFSPSARRREIDLRVSILKAFEQVGGAKELSIVERLSQGRPSVISKAGVPEEIQQAAFECLPYLQSRANEQQANRQLLRASSAQDTATDVLLRPASSQSDALPEQLLRASGESGA